MILPTMLVTVSLLPYAFVAPALGQDVKTDDAPELPTPVTFEVSLERQAFEAREPLIARVTLTNHGTRPLPVRVREDGAAYGVALHVSRENMPLRKHSLWLSRSGPQPREIELAPGQSTSGEILVLLDYGEQYVFSDAGLYTIAWCWYPGPGFAKVYSAETQVRVVRASPVNDGLLAQLELIALRYHIGDDADHLDLNAPEAKKGLDREGILLLAQIVRETKPHLIDPDDDRETKLVDSLVRALERYPDSVYSSYIARYLGLVYFKTLEHEGSLKGWGERDPERARAHPAYAKALRYLTMARDANVWPRTTALEYVVWLHVGTHEWDKATECLRDLRGEYADVSGAEIADRLENQMGYFRAKVERRSAEQEGTP
jgi:hypothetical protein